MEYGNKLIHLRAHLARKPKDQPFILALGSSLTAMELRPDTLTCCQPADPRGPLVYNYAINGSTIVVQLIYLHRLLAEGIRPDWVLVEVHPQFFLDSEKVDPRRIEHLSSIRVQWQDLSLFARYHPNPHQLRQDWRSAQCWPWYLRRHMLQNWLVPSWISRKNRVEELWNHIDTWGWEWFPSYLSQVKPHFDQPAGAETILKIMEEWQPLPINEDLHQAMREFLALCQREKIRVVLIRVPESSPFRNGYSSALTQRINRWYARLREETGVPIVNARDWLADPDFIDGLHVTPEGATHFTQRLESAVIQPLLTGTMPASGPMMEVSTMRKRSVE